MIQSQTYTKERSRIAALIPGPELVVVTSLTINAAAPRVINAITMSEYVEAWMYVPEMCELRCFAEAKTPNDFTYEVCSSEGVAYTIAARCLLLAPDRIVYSWKRACRGITEFTIIDIGLQTVRDRCKLTLTHSGFSNAGQCRWHLAMWIQSLTNLCRVLEPLPSPLRTGRLL